MSNLDDFDPHRDVLSYSELLLVDQYILHLLHKFVSQVGLAMLLTYRL